MERFGSAIVSTPLVVEKALSFPRNVRHDHEALLTENESIFLVGGWQCGSCSGESLPTGHFYHIDVTEQPLPFLVLFAKRILALPLDAYSILLFVNGNL